ncbi:cbb3-type cytochrome c oxidase subunit I [Deinococcus lacus]|uniref:Cbb3-type cytochrome c oxidase subunit I n=1 Tax=Deinococcus lacus TaxID=392561 RepID=A0ABW1YCX6_9DEIO
MIGPLQALNYADVDLYNLPVLRNIIQSYYQGLTLHGVLNALVFTQFFISGWMLYLPVRDLGAKINLKFAWGTYIMMTAGLLIAAVPLLLDQATVLYTFYPPMQGSPVFYIGASIMVAATWFVLGQVVYTWWAWKKANPGRVTPLVTYMSVATWLMWFIASLGLVIEALTMLVPWSLGLVKGIDPLLSRTLFWWTGHAIVYFWLLPAYISWYAFLPRHAGGRLVSEPLVRLAFAMFLINGTPVGLHHQFSDPNVANSWKVIHMLLTFTVAIPSLLTAFSVAASLEDAARARGGRGYFAWMGKLPWNNPVFTGQVLAMVSFILGGAGGIANASYSFSGVVHNTAWIPGHFHITVGTATTLSFMAIALWLVPHLTGKRLAQPKVALWSMWGWFAGMMVFALGMHWQGLLHVPRRSHVSAMAQSLETVFEGTKLPAAITGVSGVMLFIAGVMFFYVLFKTLLSPKVQDGESVALPYSDAMNPAGQQLASAGLLTRVTEPLLALFVVGLLAVLLVYLPVILPMITNYQFIPGQQLWRTP